MSRKETDDAEWHDPRNWHGGWLGFYYSPRDSRGWVPKRKPGYGWTVNFASRSGVLTFLLLLAVPIFVSILTIVAAR
jgi:uncharacterized membrane protein